MFLIRITIKEPTTAQLADQHLAEHQVWFTTNFQAGNFLILGPSQSFARAGVIIAQAKNRQVLDKIIAKDAYYPDLAQYEIEKFSPVMIADNLQDYAASSTN